MLKPVNETSLLVAIQNAIGSYTEQVNTQQASNEINDFVFVKIGNKYKKISWNSVIQISSEGKYSKLTVYDDKTEYYIRSSLQHTYNYFLPQPIKDNFFQANRSEMVNIHFIEEVTDDSITTKHSKVLLSDSKGKELKLKLNII